MAKKQDLIVTLAQSLQALLRDPIANYDKISAMLSEQRMPLIEMREALQAQIEWLSALDFALQANRLEWLQKNVQQQGRGE